MAAREGVVDESCWLSGADEAACRGAGPGPGSGETAAEARHGGGGEAADLRRAAGEFSLGGCVSMMMRESDEIDEDEKADEGDEVEEEEVEEEEVEEAASTGAGGVLP